MRLSLVLLAMVSIATQTTPLTGQVRLEIAPRYGVFQPTGQSYDGEFHTSFYQNRMGQIAGLSLTTLLSPRWGFEVTTLREWGAMKSTPLSGCKRNQSSTCSALPPNTGLMDNWSWLRLRFSVEQAPSTRFSMSRA